MISFEADRTWRHRLYAAVGLGLRLYVAALVVVGLYSLLWLLEVAGYLASDTLATIWLAIAGMGSVFLVVLIPVFYTTR